MCNGMYWWTCDPTNPLLVPYKAIWLVFRGCFQILDLFICNCHIDNNVINFLLLSLLSRFRFDISYKSINDCGSFNTFLNFSVKKWFWCGTNNNNTTVFWFLLPTRSSKSFMRIWPNLLWGFDQFFLLLTAAQNAFCCWFRIKLYVWNRCWLYWFLEGLIPLARDVSACLWC